MIVMEEDFGLKKFVNKKYLCGKSSDGRMKSRVEAESAESEEENGGYGLRENPKKTTKASDSILNLSQYSACKKCGEGFVSWKAFLDHGASHSEKLKVDYSCSKDSRKIVPYCKRRTESSKNKMLKRVGVSVNSPLNGSPSVSEIDVLEKEELAICLMILSRDSWNNGGVESSDNGSLVMEAKSKCPFNIQKQSEVEKTKLNLVVSNDENAETEDSDSGYFLGEWTKAESDVSVGGFRMNDTLSNFSKTKFSPKEGGRKEFEAGVFNNGNSLKSKRSIRAKFSSKLSKGNEHGTTSGFVRNESRKRELGSQLDSTTQNAPKRSKFECLDCKRTFKTFQALGGHRPCQKRIATYQSDDSSHHIVCHTKQLAESGLTKRKQPSASSSSQKKAVKSKKSNKPHVCPYCGRVFKNGHALGGHKRSHFVGRNVKQISPVTQCEHASGLLDLNLPPPEEGDELNGQFFYGLES